MLRKALIDKLSGTVIGVLEVSEKGFGKLTAGNDQLYWDCTRYAVSPGDKFIDGVFYTAADPSTPVEYIPTTDEKLAVAENTIADHSATLDALLGVDSQNAEAPVALMSMAAPLSVAPSDPDRSAIAAQLNLAMRIVAEQQTDDAVVLSMADLYEEWSANRKYKAGKIVKYGVDAAGKTQLYRVVQEHTSAAEWLPDQSASLYSKIGFDESGVEIWRQPGGAYNAYHLGDVVSHNGELWECTEVDGAGNNTWEPGVYGWTVKEA